MNYSRNRPKRISFATHTCQLLYRKKIRNNYRYEYNQFIKKRRSRLLTSNQSTQTEVYNDKFTQTDEILQTDKEAPCPVCNFVPTSSPSFFRV